MILATVYNYGNNILVRLYKTCAKTYLNYNRIIYSPHHLELINTLEQVR